MSVRIIPPDEITKLPVDAYYDALHKCYWVLDVDNNWIAIETTSLKMRLAKLNYCTKCRQGELISAADNEVLKVQDQRCVHYVGPLAGYKRGLYMMGGFKVLVTHSPDPTLPKQGDWDMLRGIINRMLGQQQSLYFYAWLRAAYIALTTGQHTVGQALVIAGPHCCGKSLLQFVITCVLGGRSAKPFRHMMGGTQFNRDWFAAEHLVIEDEAASTDLRTRRNFGAQIKQITANRAQNCHGKGKEAATLYPLWRLSITLNDEPENMAILPPLEDSIEDKLIILKAEKHAMPMPTSTAEEEAAFREAILKCLPGFVHWIMEEFKLHTDFTAARYGVAAYVHPDLLAIIDGLAPQTRALYLIDRVVFAPETGRQNGWSGTADELQHILLTSTYDYQAKQLLTYPSAMGTFLGLLAKNRPNRVTKGKRVDDRQEWFVSHPLPPIQPTNSTPSPTPPVDAS